MEGRQRGAVPRGRAGRGDGTHCPTLQKSLSRSLPHAAPQRAHLPLLLLDGAAGAATAAAQHKETPGSPWRQRPLPPASTEAPPGGGDQLAEASGPCCWLEEGCFPLVLIIASRCRERSAPPSAAPRLIFHRGAQQLQQLGLIVHQLHCLCSTLRRLGALLHLVLGQHLAEGHLALELSPGQRGNLKVWEAGLEDAGGQLQPLQHVGEEEPVAGPARIARSRIRECTSSIPSQQEPQQGF